MQRLLDLPDWWANPFVEQDGRHYQEQYASPSHAHPQQQYYHQAQGHFNEQSQPDQAPYYQPHEHINEQHYPDPALYQQPSNNLDQLLAHGYQALLNHNINLTPVVDFDQAQDLSHQAQFHQGRDLTSPQPPAEVGLQVPAQSSQEFDIYGLPIRNREPEPSHEEQFISASDLQRLAQFNQNIDPQLQTQSNEYSNSGPDLHAQLDEPTNATLPAQCYHQSNNHVNPYSSSYIAAQDNRQIYREPNPYHQDRPRSPQTIDQNMMEQPPTPTSSASQPSTGGRRKRLTTNQKRKNHIRSETSRRDHLKDRQKDMLAMIPHADQNQAHKEAYVLEKFLEYAPLVLRKRNELIRRLEAEGVDVEEELGIDTHERGPLVDTENIPKKNGARSGRRRKE